MRQFAAAILTVAALAACSDPGVSGPGKSDHRVFEGRVAIAAPSESATIGPIPGLLSCAAVGLYLAKDSAYTAPEYISEDKYYSIYEDASGNPSPDTTMIVLKRGIGTFPAWDADYGGTVQVPDWYRVVASGCE